MDAGMMLFNRTSESIKKKHLNHFKACDGNLFMARKFHKRKKNSMKLFFFFCFLLNNFEQKKLPTMFCDAAKNKNCEIYQLEIG